ncbi:hypothetical protein BaRGS_00020067 [Batillaria attramentaria]|uniref:Uncharacterized protein n=1 Tax=Batillaria attramentaria TaxID=370345 RepID=A0ABD0KND3_9CAEN
MTRSQQPSAGYVAQAHSNVQGKQVMKKAIGEFGRVVSHGPFTWPGSRGAAVFKGSDPCSGYSLFNTVMFMRSAARLRSSQMVLFRLIALSLPEPWA